MWGLGCLIHEVFNGPLTQISSLRNTSKVTCPCAVSPVISGCVYF